MKKKTISRRTLLKSGGVAAAFLTGTGVFPAKTPRSLAVAPPSHREDNVIAKSINSDPDHIPTLYGRLHNRQIAFISAIFPRTSPACGWMPARMSRAKVFSGSTCSAWRSRRITRSSSTTGCENIPG